ncbi:MAG: hypothetical protein J6Y91_01930 [Alphaproteobacteria bacterium]|nr:hypothetical protein [Alphaproteobacteria bacterium]
MAQTYEMSDGFSVFDGDNGLTIRNAAGEQFVIAQNKITRTEPQTQALSAAETKKMCHDLLRAEFFLPDALDIKSATVKTNTANDFQFQLSAERDKNSAKINLRRTPETTEFNRSMTIVAPTHQGVNTKSQTIRSLCGNTDREYSESTLDSEKTHGERFDVARSTDLSRIIKNKGRRIVLTGDIRSYEEEGFVFQHDVKTTLDITTDNIEKNISIDDEKYRQRLKIEYDLKRGKIQCRLKKTEYEAITIVEYKPTILTHKTGKKVRVTTFVDRNFDGQLTLNDDGSFRYVQEQTGSKGALEKFEERNDMQKINPIIREEVEKIKAVAAKINILKNSQNNPEQVNFAQNPSIFDEEINFSSVKDKEAVRLTDTMAHGGADVHRRLLAALQQISGGRDLALNNQDIYGR